MKAESTFQLQQMLPILYAKMGKRGIDIASLESGKIQDTGKTAQQSKSEGHCCVLGEHQFQALQYQRHHCQRGDSQAEGYERMPSDLQSRVDEPEINS